MYTLHVRQRLTAGPEEIWAYFATPANLNAMTPPSMRFRITSTLPDRMYPSMILTYRVTPLLGIPLRWMTEITHMDAPHSFVDVQRTGPYRDWHHEHRFRAVDGGVEVEDLVHYALPLDPLSRPLHDLFVLPRLAEVFTYRWRVLTERFGTAPGVPDAGPPPGALVFTRD